MFFTGSVGPGEGVAELSTKNAALLEKKGSGRDRAVAVSGLQHDFHSLSSGAHFGIVIAGFGDDFVDAGVAVIGIVVEED